MAIALTKITYTTSATVKGGRSGHVRSADGAVDLDLARPGKSDPAKANPETLFAAGYGACFQSALEYLATAKDVDASDSAVTAEVSLGAAEGGGFGLAVELKVHIPDVEPDRVRELIELAHEMCPYSRATRDNIVVTLTVI
jgi:Ohr subfamily peroxiredoxin